jgi:hypothetical protein
MDLLLGPEGGVVASVAGRVDSRQPRYHIERSRASCGTDGGRLVLYFR